MAGPAVSVVIPTYERPAKLSRAVDSVVAQTFEDWELIVVNDAPWSDVGEALPDDDRVRCIEHEENRGAPAARNTGIDAAEGEYVAVLDDDDAWKPRKLERQIDCFRAASANCGLVYAGRDVVQDGEVVEVYVPTESGQLFDTLLAGNVIPSETPLIRRECFEDVGDFDTELQSSQDLDMWLRIAREYEIQCVEASLAIAYRGHGDRISDDMERKFQGQRRIVEKYRDDFAARPEVLAQRYKTLGLYAVGAGRSREATEIFGKAIRYGADDALTYGYYLLSRTPGAFHRPVFSLRRSLDRRGLAGTVRAAF